MECSKCCGASLWWHCVPQKEGHKVLNKSAALLWPVPGTLESPQAANLRASRLARTAKYWQIQASSTYSILIIQTIISSYVRALNKTSFFNTTRLLMKKINTNLITINILAAILPICIDVINDRLPSSQAFIRNAYPIALLSFRFFCPPCGLFVRNRPNSLNIDAIMPSLAAITDHNHTASPTHS